MSGTGGAVTPRPTARRRDSSSLAGAPGGAWEGRLAAAMAIRTRPPLARSLDVVGELRGPVFDSIADDAAFGRAALQELAMVALHEARHAAMACRLRVPVLAVQVGYKDACGVMPASNGRVFTLAYIGGGSLRRAFRKDALIFLAGNLGQGGANTSSHDMRIARQIASRLQAYRPTTTVGALLREALAILQEPFTRALTLELTLLMLRACVRGGTVRCELSSSEIKSACRRVRRRLRKQRPAVRLAGRPVPTRSPRLEEVLL